MKPGRNIEPLQHRRYPHRGPTGTTHSADIFTDVHTPTAPHQIDKYKRKRDNGQQHRHRNDGVDDTHELCGTRVTLVWSAPTVARRTHRAHFEHDGANTGGRGQHYQSTEHPELRKKLNRLNRFSHALEEPIRRPPYAMIKGRSERLVSVGLQDSSWVAFGIVACSGIYICICM